GVGGALGLLTAAIGVQMIAGREGVWLPAFMRRRGVSADRIDAIARAVHPASRVLSRYLEERMPWLASGRGSLTVIASVLIVTGASLVVVGAIPVAVPLIGLPIAIFAVGLLARDGAVVAAGYVLISVAAAAIVAMI
ncbi:MAG: exopolysaccharide biosynthesis protein, partial [Roseicyclus sp.]